MEAQILEVQRLELRAGNIALQETKKAPDGRLIHFNPRGDAHQNGYPQMRKRATITTTVQIQNRTGMAPARNTDTADNNKAARNNRAGSTDDGRNDDNAGSGAAR